MLGNRPAVLGIATGPNPWTHPGETGDLAAILETVPTQNLPLQDLAGQRAHTPRLNARRFFQPSRGGLQLGLHRQEQVPGNRHELQQRDRYLKLQLLPMALLPPTTPHPNAIKKQQAASLGFQTQTVGHQLLSLTALTTSHF